MTLGQLQLPKRVSKAHVVVGLIRIDRKGSDIEYIAVNWKGCEALNAYLNVRAQKATTAAEGALFLTKYGTPMSPRSVQQMVKKYMQRAGIEDASVHTLRATAATIYAAKGGNIKTIQALLGHKSLETTQIYVGLAKRAMREMVQELAL